ncbi:MAG: hypothetical protein OXG74_08770 [Acidobacteria bacterium]|nr:hypothetical protein [Acidobacteriota bacterium]
MRRALVLLHRWLGIAGNLLFVVWFASALVMMYARMPALEPGDRLHRLPPLDLEAVTVEPARAAAAARLDAGTAEILQLRLGMAGERPIYRFRTSAGWTAVYADTGSQMLQLSKDQATAIAAQFARQPVAGGALPPLGYDRLLIRPDQWTLQVRPLFPVHRIQAGGDVLYVSDRTAEVVMETTPASRFWGTAGAVLHWLYFTPLRSHSTLWYQLIVWASAAGCMLTLSGLAVGVIRLTRRKRSPYTGIMRWHHYSGLVFGTAALTWVLSGALSMDPFRWQAGRTTSSAQHSAVAGGTSAVNQPDLASIRTALESVPTGFRPREVEFFQFAGEPLMLAYRPPSSGDGRGYGPGAYGAGPLSFQAVVQPFEHRLVTLDGGPRHRFSRNELLAAATTAMPESKLVDAVELDDYDAYYEDRRHRRLPLPVLRLRFDDAAATWLYLSPSLGRIVHREQRRSRIDRWLYRGLHRLDFPGFYHRRPLWDLVVIGLLLGGLFSAASSLAPAAKRLRRHAARLRRRESRRSQPAG